LVDQEEDDHPSQDRAERGVNRALVRGLRVLRAIGDEGADPAALATQTGIERTTIYRILHTLETEGYLARRPSDHRLILTREVQRLADGFTEAHWVTQLGAVEVGALHRKVSWPTNLATFDGEGMLVRESTHRFSSLMTHRSMVGARMSMASSMGLAFAAHMVEASCEAMIGLVARDAGTSLAEAATRLRVIREQGFALVSETIEPNIAAIAVPVFHQDVVVAAINIVVDIRLLPLASMVEALRDPLLRAARNLEGKIAAIPVDSILA